MAESAPKERRGPVVIQAANSNTISDAYRDSLVIAYQYIGSTVPTIEFSLGGHALGTPIMAGPIGGQDRAHESGPVGYAKAVADAGSVFWSDFHNKAAWTEILKQGIPALRVIKPLADMDRLLDEIAFDTENGAIGYAMDVDHGLTVYGQWDGQQEGFRAKTAGELRRLSEASPLPFYLKGVLSVHDALLAAEAGCAGIVVSGHNNRFPCAVPPLRALPDIRAAVGEKLTIFVDGGINNGYDAFKALALGADGVLCARGLMAAFAKGGPEGLTGKLREMTAELKGAMANTGSPDLAHINRASVFPL